MAVPNAIFKNGAYMNVKEGEMYIGISPSTNIINITAHCDVVFEVL